jgi:hypothetical protein
MRFSVRSAHCLGFTLLCSVTVCGGAQEPTLTAPAASNRPAASALPSAPTAPAKAKKVWTNDDVAAARPESPADRKAKPNTDSTDPNESLARVLKARLDKLNVQLADTDKKIAELQRFQAGENVGTAGGRIFRGYSTEPVPEQLQKLQAKRQQIADQIDAIYDQVRKKGILPGQLR